SASSTSSLSPSPLRTSFSISDNNSEASSSVPSTPEPNEKRRKNYRSGYETAPRSSPYTPYKLNNPGTQKRAPLELDNTTLLANRDSLDPEEWNKIAISHKLIPAGASLHSFQISAANLALSQRNDAVVISATGSGKSLTWVLPLLARQTRISLVIAPYTSLGLDGELLGNDNGVSSIFIQSERNKDEDFQKVLSGQMLVVFVCPEMLESPRFGQFLHSKSWKQALSAIYINKAHLVKQTHHWRLPYSRLYRLREIVGLDIPLVGLSATCPKSFRDALVVYAGMRSDYLLVNFGNFRPELSTIVLPLDEDINRFLNIASVMPLGQPESQLVKTLIYCDDLELLTKMYWWLHARAASMGYSEYVVDILHAGLSNRHETIALQSFRDGTTLILLGSSKISAGMNFPGVRRVVQYKCRDLTLLHFDQRRGRGARQPGETSVTIC
ncbi:P-loop containing nucleoside triphosphate hydrolase protein, partial [Mycena galopus ATCC 62051]